MIWDLLQAAGQARGQLSEAAHVQTSAFFEQHLVEVEEVHAAAVKKLKEKEKKFTNNNTTALIAQQSVRSMGRGWCGAGPAVRGQHSKLLTLPHHHRIHVQTALSKHRAKEQRAKRSTESCREAVRVSGG